MPVVCEEEEEEEDEEDDDMHGLERKDPERDMLQAPDHLVTDNYTSQFEGYGGDADAMAVVPQHEQQQQPYADMDAAVAEDAPDNMLECFDRKHQESAECSEKDQRQPQEPETMMDEIEEEEMDDEVKFDLIRSAFSSYSNYNYGMVTSPTTTTPTTSLYNNNSIIHASSSSSSSNNNNHNNNNNNININRYSIGASTLSSTSDLPPPPTLNRSRPPSSLSLRRGYSQHSIAAVTNPSSADDLSTYPTFQQQPPSASSNGHTHSLSNRSSVINLALNFLSYAASSGSAAVASSTAPSTPTTATATASSSSQQQQHFSASQHPSLQRNGNGSSGSTTGTPLSPKPSSNSLFEQFPEPVPNSSSTTTLTLISNHSTSTTSITSIAPTFFSPSSVFGSGSSTTSLSTLASVTVVASPLASSYPNNHPSNASITSYFQLGKKTPSPPTSPLSHYPPQPVRNKSLDLPSPPLLRENHRAYSLPAHHSDEIPTVFYRNGLFVTVSDPVDARGFTAYRVTSRVLRHVGALEGRETVTVFRRYREFREFYFGIRKWAGSSADRFTPSTISSRLESFSTLLTFLSLHPTLYNSHIVLEFLGIPSVPSVGPHTVIMDGRAAGRRRKGKVGGVVVWEGSPRLRQGEVLEEEGSGLARVLGMEGRWSPEGERVGVGVDVGEGRSFSNPV
ncbi:hypothetical protein HDU97_005261 [Phlyctochytrium planicorne]|nr:hypothetical protein HDU97_005261 [Phlyctochytrium planicorne]